MSRASKKIEEMKQLVEFRQDANIALREKCNFRVSAFYYVMQKLKLIDHGLRGSASPVQTATGLVNGRWQYSTPYRIDTP